MLNLKKESKFQSDLKEDLKKIFPGAIITKLDSSATQGIPDLLVIWHDKYALLECKRSEKASKQPNQEYYVDMINNWSFSAFIYPENKEEVLHEMERAWKS